MSDESIDPAVKEQSADATPDDTHVGRDAHADKYNDPRAKITSRGILMGVMVAVFAVVGAAASIHLRRIEKEKSSNFWGAETITGLELAERIELIAAGKTIELTSTPGLGHLRRALLEDSNYDWSTVSPDSAAEECDPSDSLCVQLRLTDPTAHRIGTVEIDLDLKNGWVGPSDGSLRVRATERARPALKHFLETIMNVDQLRYDFREKEQK